MSPIHEALFLMLHKLCSWVSMVDWVHRLHVCIFFFHYKSSLCVTFSSLACYYMFWGSRCSGRKTYIKGLFINMSSEHFLLPDKNHFPLLEWACRSEEVHHISSWIICSSGLSSHYRLYIFNLVFLLLVNRINWVRMFFLLDLQDH